MPSDSCLRWSTTSRRSRRGCVRDEPECAAETAVGRRAERLGPWQSLLFTEDQLLVPSRRAGCATSAGGFSYSLVWPEGCAGSEQSVFATGEVIPFLLSACGVELLHAAPCPGSQDSGCQKWKLTPKAAKKGSKGVCPRTVQVGPALSRMSKCSALYPATSSAVKLPPANAYHPLLASA